MSKAPRPRLPVVIDFASLAPIVDGLLFNLERDLRRMSEKSTRKEHAHGFLLLRIAVKTIQNSYDGMRFMCGDQQTAGQKENYALLMPVINRMLLEVLFTVMFWLDDFPKSCIDYQKAGWRELAEERQQYRTEYASAPEWKPFFQNFEKLLRTGVEELGIKEDEIKRPQNIDYWKSGAKLIEQLKGEKACSPGGWISGSTMRLQL